LVLKKLGINAALIEEKFKQSFSANSDNSYLKKYSGVLEMAGVLSFPTVTINNIKMKANLNVDYF
jgi:hypothetical protein